jgi:ribosomal protein S18 acetylase RimI-like enzyme
LRTESLTHPALGKATEVTYQVAYTLLGRWLEARFHQEGDAIWFVTDAVGFNGVISTPITANTPERTIDKILKDIAGFSRGSTTWSLGPSLQNPPLKNRLLAHGRSQGEELPSLLLDLHALQAPEKKPAGLSIEVVDHEEAFQQFMHVVAVSSTLPDPVAGYLSGLDHGDKFLHDPACRYYLGRINGEAVATTLLLQCEGIAGIYVVGTIPERRKQGIGTALTLAALADARDLGYHIAVLQASEMGVRIYRKLGFQDQSLFQTYHLQKSIE